MNTKLYEKLNDQVNKELYSGYLYLSMAAFFESENLPGFASWMKKQAREEYSHGMKIFEYINDREMAVKLTAIAAPETKWKSPLDVFEAAYKHEQFVTKLIHDLLELAIKEKDSATEEFLQWFVKEQVEEEESADAVVQKLKIVGDNKSALLHLDSEMEKR